MIDACQLLTHVVVQVARDPRALRFLDMDQPAGEVLILFGRLAESALALAQRTLGTATPDALNDPSSNQRALRDHEQAAAENVRPIELPEAEFPEEDRAAPKATGSR